jgi:hypothetical protein
MKKLLLVATLAAFALTGAAFAQDPNWQDNIGIYGDEDATIICESLGGDVPSTVYLVLTDMTQPDVRGYELKVTFENLTMLAFAPYYSAVDVQPAAGEHQVGLAAPVPAPGGELVLGHFLIMLDTNVDIPSNPSAIFIDSVFAHILPYPAPAYLNGASEPFEMHPSTADDYYFEGGTPVYVLNNGCDPIPVENETWGGVKSLFR